MRIKIMVKLEEKDDFSMLKEVMDVIEYILYNPEDTEIQTGADYIMIKTDYSNLKSLGDLKKED